MNLSGQRSEKFLFEVLDEAIKGQSKYGEYQSYHEGASVIREEFEEMWDEVKKRVRDPDRIYAECIQVAATAMRLALQAQNGLTR